MATAFYNLNDSNTDDVSFKAISGQIGIDKAEGIVECFVSAIGNKDSVGDIVVPGAFNMSLRRRKPRVVWGHDWNKPIGKVLEIYEVPKTDPRLPEKMKMAGVGGLFAKVQFNLNTELGREAFANIAFYGMEQEWSIGYKTLTADYDPARQANILKEVELYEVSPVLHGANQLTGTISVKDDSQQISEKGWQWVDDEEKEEGGKMSTLGQAISAALGKPVDILDVSDDMVVFQTADNMTWRASVDVQDGNYVIGKPKKVRRVASYIEENEPENRPAPDAGQTPAQGGEAVTPPPPDMTVKEDAEEPKGVRSPEEEMAALPTPDAALSWSKVLGCTGYHSHGGGYMPCSDHDEFMASMKKYDGNANINSSNNYLAGVEVTNAKEDEQDDAEEKQACECSSDCDGGEKCHGMGPRPAVMKPMRPMKDNDDDDDKEHLNDPMSTLLMTFNNLLKVPGAAKVRAETLKLVEMLEEFMTTVREKPSVMLSVPSGKELSGFVVELKCGTDRYDEVSNVLSEAPVYAEKSDNGTNIHFLADMSRDEIMEKVAYALAGLDFDFDISTRDDEFDIENTEALA